MTDLKKYGCKEEETPDGLLPGRVIEARRETYAVITRLGEVRAVLKGAFVYEKRERGDYPCVGDFVLLKHNETGVSQITSVLPRRSKFSRADFLGHAEGYVKTVLEQVISANFDYVFILSSLNKDFNLNRVVRYITQAKQSGGQPVVILTKADLTPDHEEYINKILTAAPDVPVRAVSSLSGYGFETLSEYLRPEKTIVFLGMSGVGKSSLLNALMNENVMKVKQIRNDDSRGRHTTTHRQLFMLPTGTMVIDTPGMRELGIFDADDGISAVFNEVEDLFLNCRFSDCKHVSEPGCAVISALADGTLSDDNWKRYLSQKRENKFADDKAAYITEKREWGKALSKFTKKRKKA